MNDLPTLRARLGRRNAFMLVERLPGGTVHGVDRPVLRDVAGEIKNEAVILAVGEPHVAASI